MKMTFNDRSFQHGIYKGKVRHRRFSPTRHSFSYPITMLGINIAELNSINHQHWSLGSQWYKPVRFLEKDYIKSEPGELLTRIKKKVEGLGGNWDGTNAFMLAQARCFGLYFSPVNFYFCIEQTGECSYMLAEVSNTPWNQRHYYLVNLKQDHLTDKAFHVSPFMQMDMKYKWRVQVPDEKAFIHIENHHRSSEISQDNEHKKKVFDATVALNKLTMTFEGNHQVAKTMDWLALPFMNFKILQGIYWQAFKLFRKKVPFVPYAKP